MATWTEALRRVYYDMVIRRSTVRVVSAEEGELTASPIFLVGVFRSGTTLLRYIVDSHSHICCPPESDFLAVFSYLLENHPGHTSYRESLLRMGFDEEHVLRKLRELAVYFFGNYAASWQKRRWADKSPIYIDHLDMLLRLFPEAQFVMIYRHGLDQAHSYTRGGTSMRHEMRGHHREGDDPRIGATRYWCDQVGKMMRFEASHGDRCLRIRYEDLCASPTTVLPHMFTFLHEPWEPRVLEYYRFPHDKGKEDGRVAATRGFSVSKGHYVSWPDELYEKCLAIAQNELDLLGYSSDR